MNKYNLSVLLLSGIKLISVSIINNAAMDMFAHGTCIVSIQVLIRVSSGTPGCSHFMAAVADPINSFFQSGCTSLYSHQQCCIIYTMSLPIIVCQLRIFLAILFSLS